MKKSLLLGAGVALALVGCRDRSALETNDVRTNEAPAEVVSTPQPDPLPAPAPATPSDIPGSPGTGGAGMSASSGETDSHVTDTTVHTNPPAEGSLPSEAPLPSEQGIGGSGRADSSIPAPSKDPKRDGGTGGSGYPETMDSTSSESRRLDPLSDPSKDPIDRNQSGSNADGLGTERP